MLCSEINFCVLFVDWEHKDNSHLGSGNFNTQKAGTEQYMSTDQGSFEEILTWLSRTITSLLCVPFSPVHDMNKIEQFWSVDTVITFILN